jgi:hypothetical protein
MGVSNWVKSVEFITAEIVTTATSNTGIALTKGQNYENCVPFSTSHSAQDYYDCKMIDIWLTGTTESGIINFRRWTQRGSTAYIKCYVVEFEPDEINVQQGTFNVSTVATHTVTLPTTLSGTNRAFMTHHSRSNASAQLTRSHAVRARVTSNTSVDFYRNNTTSSCDGHWFLAEDLGDNFRVTHKSGSSAAAGQTNYFKSGGVSDPFRTFMIGSFASLSSSDYPNRKIPRFYMYGDGSFRWDKQDVSYYTIYYGMQVVEILDKSKVYVPFEHYTDGWASPTQRDRAIGGTSTRVPWLVNLDTSSIVYACQQGFMRTDTSAQEANNESMAGVWLSASGTISKIKSGGTYTTYTSACQAVDWAGIDIDIGTADPEDIIPEGSGPGKSFVKTVENFRFTLEDFVGARVLTKGQNWENCVAFVSNRCSSSAGDRSRENIAMVGILEPGIVYYKCWDSSYQTYIDVSVVEFWPAQVKVQQIQFSQQGATTTNVPIDPVSDVNKAFILSTIFAPDNSYQCDHTATRVRFTAVDNVELYRYTSGYENEVCFFIVEDLQDHFDVRHKISNSAGSNQTWQDDSLTWGHYQTFLICSFASQSTSDYPSRSYVRTYYVSENRPAYSDKSDVSYYQIYVNWSAVRFTSDMFHTQLYTKSLTGANTVLTNTYSENFADHPHALTCFSINNLGSGRSDTSAEQGTNEAFHSVRITDYEARTIEFAKAGASYNAYGGFYLIDWIGYHAQIDGGLNYQGTPTRSKPLTSLARHKFNTTTSVIQVYLDRGQNIKQCVPFINHESGMTDYEPYRLYKTAWRQEDPDGFMIRYGAGQQTNRKVTVYVAEFHPDVKIQYDSAMMTGTSIQKTIEEVNLDRAFLHFYSMCDSSENFIRNHAVTGRIVDSTTIEFVRTSSGNTAYMAYYIVECPEEGGDSMWRVMRDYRTSLGGAASVYCYFPEMPAYDRSIFLASYSTSASNDYPSRNCYRVYHRMDHGIQFNKQDASYYNMNNAAVQCIEMNSKFSGKGFRAWSNYITLSTTNPLTVPFRLANNERFEIYRTMAINMPQGNEARVDTSAEQAWREMLHHFEFIDEGDGFTESMTAEKYGSTYTTYNFPYVYQFPELNKYFFEGYVTEQADPVPRIVRAYRGSTGELVDETMSVSGTGYFWVETPFYEEHHIVCHDDEPGFDYNDLVYGRVLPTVISGSYAYQEGRVTTSGIPEGVPSGLK